MVYMECLELLVCGQVVMKNDISGNLHSIGAQDMKTKV